MTNEITLTPIEKHIADIEADVASTREIITEHNTAIERGILRVAEMNKQIADKLLIIEKLKS